MKFLSLEEAEAKDRRLSLINQAWALSQHNAPRHYHQKNSPARRHHASMIAALRRRCREVESLDGAAFRLRRVQGSGLGAIYRITRKDN